MPLITPSSSETLASGRNSRYIFVTGGVSSSLGKGIVSASLAKLLQARGYRVTIQKLDPYINVDPGTLNPYEHGECYVTVDGAETDLDLGHYERFLNVCTTQANNITTGRIYQSVINKERRGEYLGKTVQIIPHITDEIKRCVQILGSESEFDFIITEIGGTVGDIESLPYVEALRQMKWESPDDTLVIHLTLIPYLAAAGELKTKPTQHSVKQLLELGVQPDILVCRTEHHLNSAIRTKIAKFCNVSLESVIESIDADTIYDVPLLMQDEHLDEVVLKKLGLEASPDDTPDLGEWKEFLYRFKNPDQTVHIGLVGKYVELKDSYKSISEALAHAGANLKTRVEIHWIHSEQISRKNVDEMLGKLDGILVAPGFGSRGIDGKLEAIEYARTNDVPFFGICLGMQCAVIEFARNKVGLTDAHSTEIKEYTPYPVIDLMAEQKSITDMGGTMRLGAYTCELKEGSIAREIYGVDSIEERHRHRYEFNEAFRNQFEEAGMKASGINPVSGLVEIVEIPSHRYFIASQFHPEYASTVLAPHPLFISFVKAAVMAGPGPVKTGNTASEDAISGAI
ncbi:MAG TPA: CTP synthase [Flavobacteriales bacterium]|jgi:CTP synthase|nr:CTP synthase [Flavobacteriales bacterium]HIB76562.1 CTP synthase [Flavobacteriales bacterium]HIN41701.1 CTP synthase [Flavobacteriales bacterium]HIO16346.1 CTP synthase [Flavobacteriales bacterium]HIO59254.1 CTP synthase [Flavobacteriales bacterium]